MPAGSRVRPVGSRRGPEGSCAAIAASTRGEGELHAAPIRETASKLMYVYFIRQKMALTPDSASRIMRE